MADATSSSSSSSSSSSNIGNRRIFFGDSKICYTDSCEFFLLCWLTGGLIQKSCGGFLFACCHRPGVNPDPATPYVDSLEHPDVNYGPVQRDSRTYCIIPSASAFFVLFLFTQAFKKLSAAQTFYYVFNPFYTLGLTPFYLHISHTKDDLFHSKTNE